MGPFEGWSTSEAADFADPWLRAWTGNNPENLASFYTEDAFYSDLAIPGEVRGRQALLAYFRILLGHNPDWVWTHRGSIPLERGFLNKWHASIPVGDRKAEVDGVCIVQIREGRIFSNEVYFDRTELMSGIAEKRLKPPESR
jgi:hypothetical protein